MILHARGSEGEGARASAIFDRNEVPAARRGTRVQVVARAPYRIQFQKKTSTEVEGVPRKATARFEECVTVATEAMSACDEQHRLLGDGLLMLLPRLLLTPCTSTWWSSSASKEMRERCRLFQEGKWQQLYDDSSRYAPMAAGDPAASHAAQQQAASRHLRNADAVREGAPSPHAAQLDRAVSLVRKGLVGKALRC